MDSAVILPLSDQPEQNHACLESLVHTLPSGRRGQVILVAGPHAALPDDLPPPDGCRVFRHDLSSPLAALNAAAASTPARTLCFADPGTVFLRGWWPPMLKLLRTAFRAGCVGNIHREPYSGLIDHVGIGFDAAGLPLSSSQKSPLLPREKFSRRAAVSFACCLVRRTVFERCGGFDARFHGPLGQTDFCLRAAEAGYQHFVANRSVVYHHAESAPPTHDPDLPLHDERWGQRARRWHARREALAREPLDGHFAPERWEAARDDRKRFRQAVDDGKHIGYRYLAKHWHRPWRYNYGRVIRALAQAFEPRPALLPRPPRRFAGLALPDGNLFDPPQP